MRVNIYNECCCWNSIWNKKWKYLREEIQLRQGNRPLYILNFGEMDKAKPNSFKSLEKNKHTVTKYCVQN